MDRTTLTANLKPLERRGLLTVTPDKEDRRSRRLALTDAGRALLAEAIPLWEAAQAENEAMLAEAEPDAFRRELRGLS